MTNLFSDSDDQPQPLPDPEKIIRLRIELDDVEPKIWRTFEVASNWTFAALHAVIQDVMGWSDSHLHQFTIGKKLIVMDDEEALEEGENEEEVRLDTYLKRARTKLIYEYDFGDDWSHTIVVEGIGKPEPGVRYPRVLAGARACPPEDSGGPWGYQQLLEVLADPTHKRHKEMLEWAGDGLDPEAFDLEELNEALAWARG
jgi:hypothetical protein